MTILRTVLLILHFLGLAALLGGFLYSMSDKVKRFAPGMMHGALTQLVTGIALVGVAYARGHGDDVDNAKITVKLLVALVVTVLIIMNRKKDAVPVPVWGTVGGLTILNVIVAVAWH
ncbi:hypothetical protein RN607_06180 [Demequina capsici]|uniref:Uncharacterized protein n=1 Tax=Demequina capsici TaxID=3075620 RepID=A0AA96FAC9_9MICO|nr:MULTISPECIES: hypothetical protein [unclassified Demequina]WNM25697.1 hypothetical protein RN606_05975 [Demequina sp. OYTSA14]WNM28592.1 hypothetical protein RN607_06180 [Demequina sp. PMTSA13]